ncbi:Ca2+-transporting ATPase [Sporobacter termitidis DSM 10068]|uniref:P-type Cu(+) transporter n=1 Tax=Sporobacter termitidis DSM 10068 TaxID=1123282 RepID=A0A1M5VGL8_9FIRM|nr:HAD-IC family P-type ATPase [Sporobacter termitidis]SHH74298.1 Ca2+-transporting ATPase [Sporobacter termitidis DSM 10068]
MQNAISKIQTPELSLTYRRIRIFHRAIHHNEENAQALARHVLAAKGVVSAAASALTGKILIVYDAAVTDDYQLGSLLYLFGRNGAGQSLSNVISLDEARRRQGLPAAAAETPPAGAAARGAAPYHAMPKWELTRLLNTNAERGLSEKQAQELQKSCGLNVLSEKKRKSLIAKLFGNLFSFSNRLLLGVGVVSLLAGQIPDALAIFGIVAMQTVLSTVQSHKAENSITLLKGFMVNKSRVIREGRERVIASKYLVPGDVIVVEAGDKVPADARIVDCTELRTSEASLTGEAAAVEKNMKPCREDTDVGSRHNMLYMGSDILCGRARAVVTATGMDTEIGKIALMLQNIREGVPPIQKKIGKLTKTITLAAGGLSLLFAGAGLLAGKPLGEVLVLSICFSIGAIPESLPAVVSASMARSVRRMAGRNAIVRSLPAVETLGATDVICCDKTGTLTMNEMTVRRIWADNSFYTVTGSGYSPSGEITLDCGSGAASPALERLLLAGVLCNNACLTKADGKWAVQGDPTEGALLAAAGKYGMDTADIESRCRRIREVPFDSARQCMIAHTSADDGETAYCKGAYNKVAEKCAYILRDGAARPFTAPEKAAVQKICDDMGNDALRVLAFSCKKMDGTHRGLDGDFVFLGIVGMSDPARPAAGESVARCRKAGVNVVMITGDNKNTAAEIARQVGLLTDGLIVTGAELDRMTDGELAAQVDSVQVFARTCPEQKHRIVRALKKAGHTVAMVGDGVNDAPAMKEADIGIAMGKSGSDVAKDVAGITLVDDDILTIVDAIQEGRSVTENIKNSMRYLLTGALGEVAAIGLCALGFGVLPLLSIQILWTNVIAETILGSAVAVEPPCPGVMDRPPYGRDDALVDRPTMIEILKKGLLIGLATFGVFSGAMLGGLGLKTARTAAFAALILSQMLSAYRSRLNKDRPAGAYMKVALAASAAMLAGILYLPPLSSFFGTVPLSAADAGSVLLAGGIGGL